MSSQTILVVDDEPDIRHLLKDILEDDGFSVMIAEDGAHARTLFTREKPQLVLLDIWMSDVDGISLLKEWKSKQQSPVAVIMMSGHGTVETAVEATRLGAYDFIEKPLSLAKLQLTVKHALEDSGLRRENQHLRWISRSKNEQIIGKSNLMKSLREKLQRMADYSAPVLITGPIGTNKETYAAYMHSMSSRQGNAFVPVNISGLDKVHMEQILFGDADSPGALEQATNGTLFIKDIADLDPVLQSRLLKTMERNSLTRTNNDAIPINTRIVAATRNSLEELVRKQRFDPDLFYLLSVLPVEAPTLAEHCEDMPELIQYYVDSLVGTESLPFRHFSVGAQNRLRSHTWPGNLRELRNIIQRLLIHTDNELIEADDVEAALHANTECGTGKAPDRQYLDPFNLELPLRDARENFEREYLSRQLKRMDWNISRTASVIGVERTHLYRKLKSLGIRIK